MALRTRFDQFAKQMVRTALERHGSVETDAEVPAATRWVDLWFTPHAFATISDHLGWLGRMTSAPTTLEFFHDTPGRDELTACLFKHGDLRRVLSRRKPAPPLPIQWVISSGRPDGGIEGLAFRPMTGWPPGTYEGPPWLCTRLVVVNELPVARDTLLLRLLGAGAVLTQAIAELNALRADAPERMLALPILVRLRLTVPTDPAVQTSDDQEFLMSTQDVYDSWRQATIQEGVEQGLEQGVKQGLEQGVKQGLEQGERRLLLRQLRRRFGNQVDGETERRIAMASLDQVELWAERVLSAATLAELLAD